MEKHDGIGVLVVGDIHGRFNDLNVLMNKKKPDVVLQAGDNAYFWENESSEKQIKSNTHVFMIPGNHEDFNMINDRVGRHGEAPVKLEDRVYYCPIGSTIKLNGKTIMFIGGGESVDKNKRIEGIDWFPDELLNQKDIDYILGRNIKPDIIISHTCPMLFNMTKARRYDKWGDPTRHALSIFLEEFKPEQWIFSHWHCWLDGKYNNTEWTCLNKAKDTGWWKWLFKK